MAHPYAGQAKSSEKARLKRLTGSTGKAWGSSAMYKKSSYPSKNAGTQREFTISGGSSKRRVDRLASGGSVKKRRPHATTNIIISHAGGRGGSGGGGGAGPNPPAAAPMPVPVNRPVPVPVNRPVPVPVGAGPAGPMGPGGPMPPRPPIPAGPPPGGPPMPPMRPPGMKTGGVVRKAKDGGGGKAYKGFPFSPTTEVDDAVSAHKKGGSVGKRADGGDLEGEPAGEYKKGGGVKKRQFGGGAGLQTPGPMGTAGAQAPGGGVAGLLGQAPGRRPVPAQPSNTISGVPARPAQALTVPQPNLPTSWMQRPAPGTTTQFKKGGAVHDDEAEDKELIGKVLKQKGLKKGGVVNPGNNPAPRNMTGGGIYHQQGKGFAAGGLIKTPLTNATGGGRGGKGRLAKTRAAKSVPDKTEA